MFLERLLDGLDLLGDGRQHPLLKTIELVKAAPGTDLTQTDKDTSHGLKVKRLIAVKDEDKTTHLMTEGLHRLSLTSSSRTWQNKETQL